MIVTIHDKYRLTHVINMRGVFTPLGVSRSSIGVSNAVAHALAEHFVIDELQQIAGRKIAEFAGAEAATVTHCTASGVTLSVAATMTGTSPQRIAALPDSTGMQSRVVLPKSHSVDYGHPIEQAIRLAGATPVFAGAKDQCTLTELGQAVAHEDTCCLLLVSSRLVSGEPLDFASAVNLAQKKGIPVIIDGAAQDMRIKELLATNADIVLVSAQKYLAGPTAGLVLGRASLVAAVRAQEKGIGRGMKASKEAIIGALAACEERSAEDTPAWAEMQAQKLPGFIERANAFHGVNAFTVPDQTGLPFERVHLRIDPDTAKMNALQLVATLKEATPSIWVMDQRAAEGEIAFELVQSTPDEIETVLERLSDFLSMQ